MEDSLKSCAKILLLLLLRLLLVLLVLLLLLLQAVDSLVNRKRTIEL